jgi:zinc protease
MRNLEYRIVKTLFLILVFISGVGLAQPTLTDPIPVSPDIKTGTLPNGLKYYIKKNTKPEKKMELRLAVNAGSILEEDNQQGLAHFTEHMAFNGSKNFKKNNLLSFLQSIGVKFGAHLNAYTSFDETVYMLSIPLDKPENLEKGLLVLEDWAGGVLFLTEEIEKERGVVLEESRGRKGAQDRMNQVLYPKIFVGSKYAERLPIGKDEILKTFKPEVIKKFYKDWYRPNLMAVVAVGDFDVTEMEGKIKSHFGKLKNNPKAKPRTMVEIPARAQSEGLVLTDKEATNAILRIVYPITKSKDKVTIGDYRQSLVSGLFQSMLGQRMQELTQKASPPFIFGGSNMGGFLRGTEAFTSFAFLSPAGVEPAVNALMQEGERARQFGFTASELDRVKKSMLKSIEQAYNERDKSESENYADEYVRNFLELEPIPGIENEYKYYQAFLPGITLDEVNKYAARIIPQEAKKLAVITSPENPGFALPTNEQLLAMIENASKLEVKPYEEKAIASSLLPAAPAPGKVVSEKENKEVGVTEWTLSNGVKVMAKSTDFKNDQILMSATRFGGQFLYDSKDRYSAENASTVVGQMGIGQFSPTDLQKVLAGKSVGVNPSINQLSEGVNGQSSAADLETMLQLTHLYFTQPRVDEELFKSFISKQKGFVQNMMANPQAVFQDTLLNTMYAKHERSPRLPNAETLDKIDMKRAVEIYKERFSNAAGFTFFFVGSFDMAALKNLCEVYLASLPSTGAPSNFRDIGLRPVKGVVKKEVYRGKEPKSFIAMRFTGEAAYSDVEQLKISMMVELMNIKLIEKLREDLGGMYSGGMSGSMSKNPYGNYTISASVPCGPENVDKLVKATWEEINKVKAGPTEADLNKVKETMKNTGKDNMKDNGYWRAKMQQWVELGTNPGDILTLEKRIDAITTKDIQEAAAKYFNEKNYLQVVLYPEK